MARECYLAIGAGFDGMRPDGASPVTTVRGAAATK